MYYINHSREKTENKLLLLGRFLLFLQEVEEEFGNQALLFSNDGKWKQHHYSYEFACSQEVAKKFTDFFPDGFLKEGGNNKSIIVGESIIHFDLNLKLTIVDMAKVPSW